MNNMTNSCFLTSALYNFITKLISALKARKHVNPADS